MQEIREVQEIHGVQEIQEVQQVKETPNLDPRAAAAASKLDMVQGSLRDADRKVGGWVVEGISEKINDHSVTKWNFISVKETNVIYRVDFKADHREDHIRNL